MKKLLYLVSIVCFFSACSPSKLSPEQEEKMKMLKSELSQTEKEIKIAESKSSQFGESLIGYLVEARLEILKTNKALLAQRINSLESGININIEVVGTKPNIEEAKTIELEINKQEKFLKKSQAKLSEYSGGLIGTMKHAEIATQEQTLAMLRQKYLILKYGLSFPHITIPTEDITPQRVKAKVKDANKTKKFDESNIANEIISVTLLEKKYSEQDYQDGMFFDIDFQATGLDKPARAIKGVLNFEDLFEEVKLRVQWTINEPITPGGKNLSRGVGFEYNQFTSSHRWIRATDLKDMKASFTVLSIIYQDGTKRDFDVN